MLHRDLGWVSLPEGGDALLLLAVGLFLGSVLLLFLVWSKSRQSRAEPRRLKIFKPDSFFDSHHERRRSPRRLGAPLGVRVLYFDAEDLSRSEEGWVLDHSKEGLGLWINRGVSSSDVLNVRFLAHPTVPWISVQVRYCRAMGGRYKVGCQFIQNTSEDVFRLLFGN
jgi:hypothetical protein